MNKRTNLWAFAFLILVTACKKQETTVPPSLAQFTTTANIAPYFVQNDPNSVYRIPVGFTTASNSDRTIAYTVSSPTGAAAGTQYNIASSGSIVIPAGKTVDSITVRGLFAGFPAGRRDTLVFRITGGGDAPASWSNTFRLVMQRLCPVTLSTFTGAYARTSELFGTTPYGPYRTTISSATATGTNRGRITVTNIFDSGWGPIDFDLDWNDPANFKATVVAKSSGIADAGTLGAAFAGEQVAVRPYGGQDGTFSSCDGTLTLRMQVGVAGLGWFSELYTVDMKR